MSKEHVKPRLNLESVPFPSEASQLRTSALGYVGWFSE